MKGASFSWLSVEGLPSVCRNLIIAHFFNLINFTGGSHASPDTIISCIDLLTYILHIQWSRATIGSSMCRQPAHAISLCPFGDVIHLYPSLSSSLSLSLDWSLQDCFGKSWWPCVMPIPLSFPLFQCGQKIFMRLYCLCDFASYLGVCDMIFVWDAEEPAKAFSSLLSVSFSPIRLSMSMTHRRVKVLKLPVSAWVWWSSSWAWCFCHSK